MTLHQYIPTQWSKERKLRLVAVTFEKLGYCYSQGSKHMCQQELLPSQSALYTFHTWSQVADNLEPQLPLELGLSVSEPLKALLKARKAFKELGDVQLKNTLCIIVTDLRV